MLLEESEKIEKEHRSLEMLWLYKKGVEVEIYTKW